MKRYFLVSIDMSVKLNPAIVKPKEKNKIILDLAQNAMGTPFMRYGMHGESYVAKPKVVKEIKR